LEFASVRRPFILVGVTSTTYELEHPTGFLLMKGKCMTQQEVMEALDKAGIDYEFIEEFDGSMHIIVKFEEDAND
jgi:molecular chaperone GrpE (heat shock protein)